MPSAHCPSLSTIRNEPASSVAREHLNHKETSQTARQAGSTQVQAHPTAYQNSQSLLTILLTLVMHLGILVLSLRRGSREKSGSQFLRELLLSNHNITCHIVFHLIHLKRMEFSDGANSTPVVGHSDPTIQVPRQFQFTYNAIAANSVKAELTAF